MRAAADLRPEITCDRREEGGAGRPLYVVDNAIERLELLAGDEAIASFLDQIDVTGRDVHVCQPTCQVVIAAEHDVTGGVLACELAERRRQLARKQQATFRSRPQHGR